MRKRESVLSVILAGMIGVVACQASPSVTSQVVPTVTATAEIVGDSTAFPAETPLAQPTTEPINSGENGFQELLSYVSQQWLERHAGDVLGMGIQLADVAQVRQDLSIPVITGASSSKEKVDLILALNNQNFDITSVDSKSPTSYQRYGWDIADVDQALIFRDDYTSIVRGKFDPACIKDRLVAQGYQASAYGDFTLFLKANKPTKHEPQFAVKDDTVIIGWNEAPVRSLIDRKATGRPGLDQSAAMQKLLPHLADAWGVYLAPRGSLDDYSLWLRVQSMTAKDQPFYKSWLDARVKKAGQIAWDALAISWQGKQPINLQFLYLYPTQDEAQKDVDLVKESLTTAPFLSRNEPWGKMLKLETVAADDGLILATATTSNDGLVGNAINGEEWALFPIRSVSAEVSAASTPSATTSIESTQLDSG
ncbi:MAG TPA: hypothetical protein VMP08_13420, partial [Anaerolineae bacterium]|nr:hypothetical protein [Anaerolineae bacterium]